LHGVLAFCGQKNLKNTCIIGCVWAKNNLDLDLSTKQVMDVKVGYV
jgi:hypothetical protein